MKKDFGSTLIVSLFVATPTVVSFLAEATDTCPHEHALHACPVPVIPLADAPHRNHAPLLPTGATISVASSSANDTGAVTVTRLTPKVAWS